MTEMHEALTRQGILLAQSLFDIGRTGDAETVRSLINEMHRLAAFAYPEPTYMPKRGE